ncbi:unnamed protein product [Meganyctiphanes norvegica]|uniref:C-type lectin domain-containing protein n=1 Tax=Meganyctiphanes norvegica TaxID=48144 RepID=A0AAV2STL9_MEGNR
MLGNQRVKPETRHTHSSEVFDASGPGCTYPFEPVGNGNCYFFSDEERNFQGAEIACQSLTQGHEYQAYLAVLGLDRLEDEALLNTVVSKGDTFWVGGQKDDSNIWYWSDDRAIDMEAHYWFYYEPNEDTNECAITNITISTNYNRGHIYDSDCSTSRKFICQTGCPFNFRRIGKFCYLISSELGLSAIHWQDARDYCQALAVPAGHHADLAVLGMPEQDDYHLLNTLLSSYDSNTWIGGFAETDCNYVWVDGREIPSSSLYWDSNGSEPACSTEKFTYLTHVTALNRTYLRDATDGSRPFICQMFATTQRT